MRRLKCLLFPSLAAALLVAASITRAQNASSLADHELEEAGDQSDNPGPLAANLSPALDRATILKTMRLVADWQLKRAKAYGSIGWTYATLYDGFLAASDATGEKRYRDRVAQVAAQNHWSLGPRFAHADDEAIGFAYLTLYAQSHSSERLAPTLAGMDKLIARPDDPDNNLWWWCDALYMAPPVLAQLSVATGDRRYLDFMDREWWLTSAALYDPAEHLYFRDKSYLKSHEANGQKLFWSRGNGWVLASLALVLERMPKHFPHRGRYLRQYREMAERIASVQQSDGLWRSGLLDPAAYPLPEVSGSAFYTFAMAWGIRYGVLDRAKYLPVVSKAWAGMLTHIYADGRLGSIQPIGGAPDKFKPSSSYVFGVGAFLLAGAQLAEIVPKR